MNPDFITHETLHYTVAGSLERVERHVEDYTQFDRWLLQSESLYTHNEDGLGENLVHLGRSPMGSVDIVREIDRRDFTHKHLLLTEENREYEFDFWADEDVFKEVRPGGQLFYTRIGSTDTHEPSLPYSVSAHRQPQRRST